MSENTLVKLSTIQETMLIPLYGRAVETAKPRGVLHDPKAVEMVAAIDYDFASLDANPHSLFACALRTAVLDEWVGGFLKEHPSGTVVEIGAGLNTRFERVDNGSVHWIDLDLPDSMALRRRFFEESDRRALVAASVLDDSWPAEVAKRPGPYFFVSEAVLVYLEEEQVRALVRRMSERFPGARFALDTFGRTMVEFLGARDVARRANVTMSWVCDDPAEVERWDVGATLLESCNLAQLPPAVSKRLPTLYRVGWGLAGGGRNRDSYKLNLFALS
ncbi:class I SAM-dependent methyltransferase [Nonomuraea sp. NPDC049400]|uniref:class I SAM-dependent methyltransferase n=1 Tax=Nonomuraea sp. NPDC049400 TaxID=3364352 RepID=UPI0037B9A0F5